MWLRMWNIHDLRYFEIENFVDISLIHYIKLESIIEIVENNEFNVTSSYLEQKLNNITYLPTTCTIF